MKFQAAVATLAMGFSTCDVVLSPTLWTSDDLAAKERICVHFNSAEHNLSNGHFASSFHVTVTFKSVSFLRIVIS